MRVSPSLFSAWHALSRFAARRQTVLCREGLYYLLMLAFVICGALLRDINLLMVVAGMMLGPLLFNIRAVHVALLDVRVERTVPEAIYAGDLLTVSVALENQHPRGARRMIVVEDTLTQTRPASRQQRQRPALLFSLVPAGETRHATYGGRLEHRGRYRLGPLKLSTRFPLGLVRRVTTIDQYHELLVYPRLGRLTTNWSRLHRDMLIGSRPVRRQQGAMEAEFFGLREWRTGDSRRNIHWRTTARRGELMVRQHQQQRDEDLLLLVDLWQPASPNSEELRRVEHAVSFAATAVAHLCRRGGSQLHLGIVGREQWLAGGTASSGLQSEMMEKLALAAAGSKYRLADLLPRVLEDVPPGTTTVVLTTRPSEFSQDLADELPADTALRWAAMHVVSIDVGSERLADYFQLD